MGDRANIFVIDREQEGEPELHGIYLYTHYSGSAWPEMLRETLNLGTARNRWDDPSYLTRILVSHLYADLGVGETGGGIGTELTDNEHEIVVLDIPRQLVAFANPGEEVQRWKWFDALSFEEYCGQVEALYPADREEVEVIDQMELEA